MKNQTQEKRETKAEEETSPFHGDFFDAILSHVPLVYLLPASHVSKSWQRSISASSTVVNSHELKPWLIINVQSRRNHSSITTHAYDPNSHVWIDITRVKSHLTLTSPIRSSNPNLLYTFPTPSKLGVSTDALNDTWQFLNGPKVWRNDPIVAVVSNYIVVAGGAYDFEDDPLAVQSYNMASCQWDTCQPLPLVLKGSASAMWLSVAASSEKMFLLEKKSGKICSFDPKTNIWGPTFDLQPTPSIYFSVIGLCSRNRLVLIGIIGEIDDVESIRMWEVNHDTYECKEIAKMPTELLEKLLMEDLTLMSINILVADDFVYMYNPYLLEEIIFCQVGTEICQWGSFKNLVLNDRNWTHRFVFTCSKVGFKDLRKVSTSGNRKFTIKSMES